MTMVVCSLLCIAVVTVTALYCLKVLPSHARLWRLALLAMPLGQLAFALSALWIATMYGLSAMYLAGICVASTFSCTGFCALAQSMSKTQRASVSKERACAAEEKAQATVECEALLAEDVLEMRKRCEQFALELRALKAVIGEDDDAGGNDCVNATRSSFSQADFAPLEAALGHLGVPMRTAYCANITANAIIALKAHTCATAGIAFSFEGGVPQELAIDDLGLCSVLGNLLDNAIHAASRAAGKPAGEGYVRVSCTVKGVYLIVKVSNSCVADDGVPAAAHNRRNANPTREHGWGLEIVRDICTAHGGSFSLERVTPTEAAATAILKVGSK